MEFITSIYVKFTSDEFAQYLKMLGWPFQFKKWLEVRKKELQSAKDNLFNEMGEEKQQIFNQIKEFIEKIAMIKNEGLINEAEIEQKTVGKMT